MADRGLLDLGIARLPGLKPNEKALLCQSFEDEASFFSQSNVEIAFLIGRCLKKDWTMDEIRRQAEQDAVLARRRGIAFVPYTDPRYPPQLKEIFDPPPVLFYRGKLPDLETPLVAIVGTRQPTGPASAQAYEIARELGRLGFPVVSGLAFGIDALAHRGNLEGGAPTIAVLGSSPDEVYPAANRPLARRTVEGGGVLLSEYPPGTMPAKWTFPARNRIISGLARGVLIVEAPERSGALITARFATEQNRDLWVAAAGAVSVMGQGTAQLAASGAMIITSAIDILKEWGFAVEKNETNPPINDSATFNPSALAADLAKTLGIASSELFF
jgi:DNA processing protein